MQHLQNHIVIVTGAASGIGQQVAIQAAERGGYVIATDINAEGLEITKKANRNIEMLILDVSKPDAIIDFAQKIIPTLQGKPLVLINNAGVALDSGPFINTTLQDFEWLLSINLWGVIRMTKAFLPYLLETNAGHIVNLSSVFEIGRASGRERV